MTGPIVRQGTDGDLPAIFDLNEHAVPHVNRLTLEAIRRLVAMAGYFRVASLGGHVVGFLIGLTPEAPYDSPNFCAFRDWFADFVYIDRIAVGEGARFKGVARHLYGDITAYARPFTSRLTCEVNIRPPNAASLAFHRKMGFSQAGTQQTEGGRKTVALLMKLLS